jgi:hypothetical protein
MIYDQSERGDRERIAPSLMFTSLSRNIGNLALVMDSSPPREAYTMHVRLGSAAVFGIEKLSDDDPGGLLAKLRPDLTPLPGGSTVEFDMAA